MSRANSLRTAFGDRQGVGNFDTNVRPLRTNARKLHVAVMLHIVETDNPFALRCANACCFGE
jgi:hypothetical protein